MRGMSLSLMAAELKSAKDLSNIFPCPHPEAAPPKVQSLGPIHGQPAGDKTDSDSWKSYSSDSEEWDEPEYGNWSSCPTPSQEEMLMWEEVTKSPHRQNKCLVMECDSQESDWDSEGATGNQWEGRSESRSVQNSPRDEQPGKSTPISLHKETQMEASMGPSNQDVVQIHAGYDDLN